eukprot:TRINITY_DN31087_c0_g1_i1.p1 TRINITY_DN31087_c0_g1~~TRINITY_DN31087_c0_g1_i1.p1  ORF type:complete len:1227 (-),score=201.69 TRINITY_DN31087_c0_g1_i1:60-3383(-)
MDDADQNGHIEVSQFLRNKQLEAGSPTAAARMLRGKNWPACQPSFDVTDKQDMMNAVLALLIKKKVFSYPLVQEEVQYVFGGLGMPAVYFQHCTSFEIAQHVHGLISAKHYDISTSNPSENIDFVLNEGGNMVSFVSAIGCPAHSSAAAVQRRAEERVADHLTLCMTQNSSFSLAYMASQGAAFPGAVSRLGIYRVETGCFSLSDLSEDESRLEVLSPPTNMLEASDPAIMGEYQTAMRAVVSSRNGVVRVVEGEPGCFVVIFATALTVGRHYLPELSQAMRVVGLAPGHFYLNNFANGAIICSMFFADATHHKVEQLKTAILYSVHLKNTPAKSGLVYKSVMQSQISHECGVYLMAGVKFVYAFFPKEQYAREYTGVHKVLQQDPSAQRKLETLYKLCIKDLLSTERIYGLVHRHPELAWCFYEDFRKIAMGLAKPTYNEELGSKIDSSCSDPQDRQILRMFLTFNESIVLTNFFKKSECPGAFAFRLNPSVVLKNRPESLYPAMPYGIYLVSGNDFMGFHTRFRDVARGGIRLILSREQVSYERNLATLFDECYNLALTQQAKNKDIPEGGSKGVILPLHAWPSGKNGGNVLAGMSVQSPTSMKSCFTRYLGALLDCMLPEQSGIYSGHLQGKSEMLFFGPDENTANFMDLGAKLAGARGYPYWKALTTGKSVKLGGVPHDTYGMTTASVHTYVLELLRELGEDESQITKFQTGGPDGDLGSNEILVSKDRTVGIVDGSGVLYDPAGLNREELRRLATARLTVQHFDTSFLGDGGFMVAITESNVILPDGSKWHTGAELRDNFHLTHYAAADLFVPCGGRPNAVNTDNVKCLFLADGITPKFRMVVEGANLFLSDAAREVLENAGVHLFKDASTNKGGVNSSSLEVMAALALDSEDHASLMCYDPKTSSLAPEFYSLYVQQILATIVENAKLEFRAIWKCNQEQRLSKVESTRMISRKINEMQDSIMEHFETMQDHERNYLVDYVLGQALPPVLINRIGVQGIKDHVPRTYIAAVVGSWVASHFIYKHGVDAGEVAFFLFLQALLPEVKREASPEGPEGTNRKSSVASISSVVTVPELATPRGDAMWTEDKAGADLPKSWQLVED